MSERYVLAHRHDDRGDAWGIYDHQTGDVAPFGAHPRERVEGHVADLNAGRERDWWGWGRPHAYKPIPPLPPETAEFVRVLRTFSLESNPYAGTSEEGLARASVSFAHGLADMVVAAWEAEGVDGPANVRDMVEELVAEYLPEYTLAEEETRSRVIAAITTPNSEPVEFVEPGIFLIGADGYARA